MFHLTREVGEICRCSGWEKGNFFFIYELKFVKYGQTEKNWPSSLSLSLSLLLTRCLNREHSHFRTKQITGIKLKKGEISTLTDVNHFIKRAAYLALISAWRHILNLKNEAFTNYNHFHNVLRLFDVLRNFAFTTSETMRDYYL